MVDISFFGRAVEHMHVGSVGLSQESAVVYDWICSLKHKKDLCTYKINPKSYNSFTFASKMGYQT